MRSAGMDITKSMTGDPRSDKATIGRPRLKIAVPKGSLFAQSVALLKAAGIDTTGLDDPGRQLVFYNDGVELYIVRPTDVPVFASYGGVDCAICGKDSLMEAGLEVVELADLKFGACRFVVAEPAQATGAADETYQKLGVLRVATKYPRITARYYQTMGVQVELIKMHGNIELTPLCGMADRIVDITATGTTLKENNLVIIDDVLESTARFVGNPASVRIDPRVREHAERLKRVVEADDRIDT
ncbi:MAG TPA: ATP phosphoribosyltransferase [Coriobacteriia bacterium]|nr:ATP phosphoribosyltransferase [Coriobacteriia bacterium]